MIANHERHAWKTVTIVFTNVKTWGMEDNLIVSSFMSHHVL